MGNSHTVIVALFSFVFLVTASFGTYGLAKDKVRVRGRTIKKSEDSAGYYVGVTLYLVVATAALGGAIYNLFFAG